MPVARFWRDIPSRYNLYGSRCGSCGKIYFPTRHICPECRRSSIGRMESYRLSGKGKVYSYSVVHEAPPQLAVLKPYVVAIVEMDEGVRVTGQLVDVDAEKIDIGMRVEAVLRKIGDEGPSGVIHYGFKFAPVPD
ncbi:MAG: uncharacterized protein PWQ88_232 [Candidatus Methanomethylophilaceae archaeon]|nr:uncharacterized protein [Candidatus Methanomethylophilaceae archaeon]MDI3542084.1 uncharacterized protein [Candidatus Methanomethylophilaceae archaeon]HIJ00762.1 Zn-ribbon domain-containing OB-fold protein [Candidatus Methanomethylophilaceae archaeon]